MNAISHIWRGIVTRIRHAYWKKRLAHIGRYSVIGSHVDIANPHCVSLGDDVSVADHCRIAPCISYAGVDYTPRITIGSGTWLGEYDVLAAIDSVCIGRNVLFASHVHISDHSHGYENPDTPIKDQPLISKGPVTIGDDCWLGFGCEILSGVKIGDHSVVAARSVVTKDVPPYCLVAGNPARVVKKYDKTLAAWVRI